MIQITRTDVITDTGAITRLRQEFAQKHYVQLPGLLEPALLQYLMRHLETAEFVIKTENHEGEEFGRTLFMPQTEPTYFLFHLFLNRPKLFHLIQQITGCGPIGNFLGRIHRSVPGDPHHIDWHDDIDDNRLVGLNINLSVGEYEGGLFQLRCREAGQMLAEVGNLGLGNAFLFRISPNVQHRLTPMVRGASRTVGVGWFRSQPEWTSFAKSFFIPSQRLTAVC